MKAFEAQALAEITLNEQKRWMTSSHLFIGLLNHSKQIERLGCENQIITTGPCILEIHHQGGFAVVAYEKAALRHA